MELAKIAVRGSTQKYLDIADIKDDLVILADGSVALLVRVSAVNFGLLSEREQEAIIFAYAGFLNSLNFAVQIVIRSQAKDISQYVALLEQERSKQTNQLLAQKIESYKNFILQTVKENNVLDKKFYIVIPFSSLELGIKKISALPKETILEKAKIALFPKRDHVLRQLSRIGLRARQLTTSELTDLFYEIYNQDKITNKSNPPATNFEQIKANVV